MLEPFSASNHNLRVQPPSDPEPATRSLILSLKVLADDESDAWREWILNAPPGAVEADLNIPGTGGSLECWKTENYWRFRREAEAAAGLHNPLRAPSLERFKEDWGQIKAEGIKAEELKIKTESYLY
jgi:hypothetical protein